MTREFKVVPIPLAVANDFVSLFHRHHGRVVGHKYSLGLIDASNALCGIVIVGRPVARMRDDGLTLEVTRLATDGTLNACSALYGAARRAARALGYRRIGTYTLESESGVTLRAAGWQHVYTTEGGSWDTPSRARRDKHPTMRKDLWESVL